MAKWYGDIGFLETSEVEPGIWIEQEIVKRPYYGEIISNKWKRQFGGQVNDNVDINNQISILADEYAFNHVSTMAWIEFYGEKWKISDVEVQHPRLIINIGGVWNGN